MSINILSFFQDLLSAFELTAELAAESSLEAANLAVGQSAPVTITAGNLTFAGTAEGVPNTTPVGVPAWQELLSIVLSLIQGAKSVSVVYSVNIKGNKVLFTGTLTIA
jgi:hypothetical protein